MKNYLREDLSEGEKAELKSIIWRVAKKYKLELYERNKQTVSIIEDLDVTTEDHYNFEAISFPDYSESLNPLTESQKTNIVNKLNMLMDELWLFELKKTLTFNEKLVFFLLSVERLKGVEVMKLLSLSKRTIYNRRKSIESKINRMIGGLTNGKKL